MGGDDIHVESAGLEPADAVNPLVVDVMKEVGVDLSRKKPQQHQRLARRRNRFLQKITSCATMSSFAT